MTGGGCELLPGFTMVCLPSDNVTGGSGEAAKEKKLQPGLERRGSWRRLLQLFLPACLAGFLPGGELQSWVCAVLLLRARRWVKFSGEGGRTWRRSLRLLRLPRSAGESLQYYCCYCCCCLAEAPQLLLLLLLQEEDAQGAPSGWRAASLLCAWLSPMCY